MRKIATIENEIARAETRIAKANEAIAKAETRLANAIAKCKKAGYEYKGDGKDVDRAYDMFHNWDIAWGPVRTADQARENIEKNKNAIFGSNYDLESLRKELAQANDKINSIPQAIKDYEPKLADSFIMDSKFRRDMTIKEIAERKEDGKWMTREDACNAFEKANAVARRLDSAEWQEYDRIKAILKEQEELERLAAVTDEQIEASCKEDAHILVIDLANRVANCIGTATDCKDLRVTTGTHGYSVLNGIVVGDKGRCEVVSKVVAGYNIIRKHVRVNVWKVA